ncbi:hypothetical protein EKO27_g28 [Xylaria grammica]|uniref:Major facilitator superfamily (MFS) profile domain-containing protein n=1 Tax=Xylaria grammica TaxID=363999 RepID=A0A439DKQ0_9PEZI|nr:hypothetical protein EKO27_g28 [Xylaria grammica]
MSYELEKTEELPPTAQLPEQRRRSNSVATTATEKESVDAPISPELASPPSAHNGTPGETDGNGGPLGPVRSVTSSMRPRNATPVPKESRRGLLPWLSLIPEVDKPHHYGNGVKWVLTLFVAIAASAAPMGSAILYPSLEEIATEFHVSPTVVNLSVAVYMLAMAIFPLWWSSFSETLGRRSIYLTSFVLNAVFTAASGVSQNIAQLIVFRIFAGALRRPCRPSAPGSLRYGGRCVGVAPGCPCRRHLEVVRFRTLEPLV